MFSESAIFDVAGLSSTLLIRALLCGGVLTVAYSLLRRSDAAARHSGTIVGYCNMPQFGLFLCFEGIGLLLMRFPRELSAAVALQRTRHIICDCLCIWGLWICCCLVLLDRGLVQSILPVEFIGIHVWCE